MSADPEDIKKSAHEAHRRIDDLGQRVNDGFTDLRKEMASDKSEIMDAIRRSPQGGLINIVLFFSLFVTILFSMTSILQNQINQVRDSLPLLVNDYKERIDIYQTHSEEVQFAYNSRIEKTVYDLKTKINNVEHNFLIDSSTLMERSRNHERSLSRVDADINESKEIKDKSIDIKSLREEISEISEASYARDQKLLGHINEIKNFINQATIKNARSGQGNINITNP